MADSGHAAPAGSVAPAGILPVKPIEPATKPQKAEESGFDGSTALKQELLFLAVQHGFRFTEEKTRRELGGPFLKEWFHAVRGLQGWKDGGRQFTNYVAHPMYGAVSAYVHVQNDSRSKRQEFGMSGDYWRSRLKAMGWAALVSTQFELGPISQASIGNVGGGIYEDKKMGYVDLVITPTLGTAWVILEDALDRHFIRHVENKTSNLMVRRAVRIAFNPMRSCANLLRFKVLWYKDLRPLDH